MRAFLKSEPQLREEPLEFGNPIGLQSPRRATCVHFGHGSPMPAMGIQVRDAPAAIQRLDNKKAARPPALAAPRKPSPRVLLPAPLALLPSESGWRT